MTYTIYDFAGNIGTFLIIGTYLLLQFGKIDSKTLLYSILNALGAGLIIVSLAFDFNFSAFVVELFWVLISAFGIVMYFLRKSKR
ncbi:MAG: hypothetical protein H7Z37_07370 [Pyrinomonadaceae bacterium]|nr:hypothetical protein [Pyrinomonadaceae bacterium]